MSVQGACLSRRCYFRCSYLKLLGFAGTHMKAMVRLLD